MNFYHITIDLARVRLYHVYICMYDYMKSTLYPLCPEAAVQLFSNIFYSEGKTEYKVVH